MIGEFKVKIGEAEVVRVGDRLKVRDRYSVEEFLIDESEEVKVEPSPPINVPQKIASHLMIELESPILISGELEFWVEAPFEVAVKVRDKTIKYLSPIMVKHALYGDIVDGIICRFFKSKVSSKPFKSKEVATCKIVANGEEVRPIRKLVLPVENLKLYSINGRVYYETVKVEVDPEVVRVILTREPPVEAGEVKPSNKKGLIRKPTFEMLWW